MKFYRITINTSMLRKASSAHWKCN